MASPAADFERIYRRHARDVYRFALSVVRNPLEAEDVTQTTFLNAYRALERGDRPERPRSWLLAIAHNAIRSHDRWRLRRPPEVPLEAAEYRLAAQPDESLAVGDVLQALGELPDAQRAALALRELQGQTYPEIAEVLGVSVSAVESLIARARRALRAQRERLAGIAVLRRLCEHGDGVPAKAAVAVAAATALAGGMAVETRVTPPPTASAQTLVVRAAPRAAVRAPRTTAPQARLSAPTTTVRAEAPPTTAPAAAQSVTATSTTAAATATTATTGTAAAVSAPTTATELPVTELAATVPAVTTPAVITPAVTAPTVTLPPLHPPPTLPTP